MDALSEDEHRHGFNGGGRCRFPGDGFEALKASFETGGTILIAQRRQQDIHMEKDFALAATDTSRASVHARRGVSLRHLSAAAAQVGTRCSRRR